MSLHSALFCHKAPNTKAFVSTWTSYGIVLAIYEGLIERGRRGRDRMVVGYITTQCNQYLPPLNL
jgi:hypothetical protein